MNSTEMGVGTANYIAVANRVMEIAVQRGTEAGIRAAMEYLTEERKQLKMYQQGALDWQIAQMAGVAPSTICQWRKRKGLATNCKYGAKQ